MRLNSIKRQHSRLASCSKLFPQIPTTSNSISISDTRVIFVAVDATDDAVADADADADADSAAVAAAAADADVVAVAFERKLCKF